MKRKAQSEIITTVLLILIVLAGIAILWLMIRPFLWTKPPTACTDVRLSITEARSNESASVDTNQIEIKRMAGGNNDAVIKVKIIIDGKSVTIQKVNDFPCSGTPNPCELPQAAFGGRTPYSLQQIETKTYEVPFTDIPKGALVEIAPVLNEDGEEKVCQINDRKNAI